MRKIAKVLSYILVWASILWIIGTVGADDRATLSGTVIFSFEELMFRCLIGVGGVIAGLLAGRMVENA
jgi:hypothetical protein